MKTIVTTLIFLLCAGVVSAQEGVHKGMIRTQGTLAAGYVPARLDWNWYLYGEAEYLLADQVGLNGNLFVNVGSPQQELATSATTQGDYRAHDVFFGPVWHFTPGSPLDLNLGVQPGAAWVHAPGYDTGMLPVEIRPELNGIAPLASLNAGAAYYGSFFHLFAQVRGIAGRYRNAYYDVPLGEVRLSFGLGFNFN